MHASIALYPGSFDPVTRGHEDIARRACQLFEKVIVAVANNDSKLATFDLDTRLEMLRKSLGDLPGLEVTSFTGLTSDYATKRGARAIIRGLRAMSDFEYECSMSQMNRTLAPDIPTVFLMAELDYQFLSSRMVREVSRLHGCVDGLVAPHVAAALKAHWGSKANGTNASSGTQ